MTARGAREAAPARVDWRRARAQGGGRRKGGAAAPLLDDPVLQKRAYGCAAELCARHGDAAWAAVLVERDAPVACRAKRTAAVTALVARRAVPNVLVARLASEAALGTRDANAHARKAAFALLDALAARADPRELLQMLSAALVAQTAHMRAAGLCALSRVVYVCPGARGDLPALLEAGVLLLGDPATEVQTAALQFLRVATAARPARSNADMMPARSSDAPPPCGWASRAGLSRVYWLSGALPRQG